VQERQLPPSGPEAVVTPESAPRRNRALRVAAFGSALTLALFALGCPGPADLDNPGQYQTPPGAAGSGTGGSGTAGTGGGGGMAASCLAACVTTIINTPGTGCKNCHGSLLKIAGTLDMEAPGLDARLKDKPAEHAGLPPGTACPSGDKLIDSAMPANSWLLKKIKNQQDTCGDVMPSTGALSAADQACFETYVNCVAAGTP
jgi:hypothetical protein